ncbi:YqzL family protein [Paenibacillus mendelii]|uniref:YqzL family protein n=1 Tax=Paenibacillus mendelii TaxID=206163 RepID=A0ABV6JHP8_9BACL|nr:YqzL family protein [Paenibacillus mendelii]MCQ6558319.1 YqzL family protein [Paenibacillus mendelii]
MRDFSWKYFTLTGDVDAFLLYKEMDQMAASDTMQDGDESLGTADSDGDDIPL